ncbi:hypothetical protein QQ045_007993 [Rhodiola kirilowii]
MSVWTRQTSASCESTMTTGRVEAINGASDAETVGFSRLLGRVANAVARLSPYLAFAILLNNIQPALSGVECKASLAYINIGSYYLIGVPIGVSLGHFTELQIQGMWIGLMSGVIVQTLMLAYMTWITDWDE